MLLLFLLQEHLTVANGCWTRQMLPWISMVEMWFAVAVAVADAWRQQKTMLRVSCGFGTPDGNLLRLVFWACSYLDSCLGARWFLYKSLRSELVRFRIQRVLTSLIQAHILCVMLSVTPLRLLLYVSYAHIVFFLVQSYAHIVH